jgi:hypothetical protein
MASDISAGAHGTLDENVLHKSDDRIRQVVAAAPNVIVMGNAQAERVFGHARADQLVGSFAVQRSESTQFVLKLPISKTAGGPA